MGGGGVFWASQKWKVLKCQDLPKFEFGGVFWESQKWKVLKCQDLPKFNFFLGGGVFWASQKWKVLNCQALLKFQFRWWGGILGKSKVKSLKLPRSAQISISLKCQDLPKFEIFLGGVFWASQKWKVLIAKLCPNFNFGGGGGGILGKSKVKSLKLPSSAQISISVGGGGLFWASQKWKVLNCQDLPKFQFR